jgi:hypothetical protein
MLFIEFFSQLGRNDRFPSRFTSRRGYWTAMRMTAVLMKKATGTLTLRTTVIGMPWRLALSQHAFARGGE